MSEDDPAPPSDLNRSPWTSLEVAKLIMAAATPLALFSLGYYVTKQDSEAASSRQERAEKREADLNTNIRKEGADLQRELRNVADRREGDRRREGFEREKALRDEAFRREDAVRQQALALGRSSKIADRRVEFWDKLAPKLREVDKSLVKFVTGSNNLDEVEAIFDECYELFALYRPYFSPKFKEQYQVFRQEVIEFMKFAGQPGKVRKLIIIDFYPRICQRYSKLRDIAALEVAQSTDVGLRVGQSDDNDPEILDECQRRFDSLFPKIRETI